MRRLEICDADLLATAYADMLENSAGMESAAGGG
jgi:hypothetical protein